MLKDQEILKKLNQIVRPKFEQIGFIDLMSCNSNSYALDERGFIFGLSIFQNEVPHIALLSKLKHLSHFNLTSCRSLDSSLLEYLGEFPLSYLNLKGNQLADISFLKHIKGLTYLDLSNNKINNISSLQDLTKITHLNLADNQVSDISFLRNLKMMTYLNLQRNKVSDIFYLKDLRNLRHLYLCHNKIYQIPYEIVALNKQIKWGFDNAQGFYFEENPLEKPPIEILTRGQDAIKAYYKSIKGKEKALNEVKILLVGYGGSGKTSLVKQLLGKKFDKNESQTHGININNWDVFHEKNKIKVRLWDFGGQEIMHATHQFFLSKRSIYVLVLDGRKDEKTEYWLKHIESFGGDSPILVVLNKIDENPSFEVNRKFLLEKYKNIKEFFRVSCLNRSGIERFALQLVKELAQVELIRTTWGIEWFNVKERLDNMKEDFISYEQYRKICLKEKININSSQDFLMDFLHDLGVIIHFRDFELHDTQVLNPRWITNSVYKIINSQELAYCKGLLKLTLLDEILKPDVKNNYYCPREKYKYIIQLMKKFELCYKIDEETILIPDLLEVQEPEFNFSLDHALKFQFEYDFLPKSVMPRFIVNMHQDILENLQWRTGVVLHNENFDSTAIIRSDDREKTIFIEIYGTRKRDYFAVLLHTIRKINDSFEKLIVYEKVPMPDNPTITVSYKHLLHLEEKGKANCEPDGAEREYNVKYLLGTFDKAIYKKLILEIESEFKRLLGLKPQNRGFAFEKFLSELFRIFDLKPMDSFRNVGEQIDGSFQLGNDFYLVEAKWQKKEVNQSQLSEFIGKVTGKAIWTRGIFISISGFSPDGIKAVAIGKRTSIIGIDGADLEYILSRKITLPDAISLKLRYAAETNIFFAPIVELEERYKV